MWKQYPGDLIGTPTGEVSDIDVLDIAVAPGTGTPEPGGLTYAEVRDAVRAIARRCRVVGFDLAGAEYDLSHMSIDADRQANVTFKYYPSGHMVYIEPESAKKLHDDIEAWMDSAR